jgi:hypothetical protein
LGLALYRFEDFGLTPTSTDMEIWLVCQAENLLDIDRVRGASRLYLP